MRSLHETQCFECVRQFIGFGRRAFLIFRRVFYSFCFLFFFCSYLFTRPCTSYCRRSVPTTRAVRGTYIYLRTHRIRITLFVRVDGTAQSVTQYYSFYNARRPFIIILCCRLVFFFLVQLKTIREIVLSHYIKTLINFIIGFISRSFFLY